MMNTYATAYWINGDLVAHLLIGDASIEVVVIPADHPDYAALVEMAGGFPQTSGQGE